MMSRSRLPSTAKSQLRRRNFTSFGGTLSAGVLLAVYACMQLSWDTGFVLSLQQGLRQILPQPKRTDLLQWPHGKTCVFAVAYSIDRTSWWFVHHWFNHDAKCIMYFRSTWEENLHSFDSVHSDACLVVFIDLKRRSEFPRAGSQNRGRSFLWPLSNCETAGLAENLHCRKEK